MFPLNNRFRYGFADTLYYPVQRSEYSVFTIKLVKSFALNICFDKYNQLLYCNTLMIMSL